MLGASSSENEQEVTEFWDKHIPIFMSVRDEYEYYAIDLTNGAVVYGFEPEFESIEETALSFTDFLDLMMKGKIRGTGPLRAE